MAHQTPVTLTLTGQRVHGAVGSSEQEFWSHSDWDVTVLPATSYLGNFGQLTCILLEVSFSSLNHPVKLYFADEMSCVQAALHSASPSSTL